MSNKTVAVSTAIIIISMVTAAVLRAKTDATLPTINPIAALAAVMVVIAGLVWFKKTSK